MWGGGESFPKEERSAELCRKRLLGRRTGLCRPSVSVQERGAPVILTYTAVLGSGFFLIYR